MVCWSPLKQTAQKLSKTYKVFRLKQIESMRGHWFISLWEQDHAVLGSALHFIQITWFTYIFANIGRVPKWVQFAGCSLDLVTWASEGFFSKGAREDFSHIFLGRGKSGEIYLFPTRNNENNFFCWNLQNPGGGKVPSASYPTPMPRDIVVSRDILRLF